MEIPGFLGAEVLRREDDDEFEFTTLTRFASMEAVKAFAGDDPETARVAPEARRLLSHFDQTCTHHRIVVRFKPVEESLDVRL